MPDLADFPAAGAKIRALLSRAREWLRPRASDGEFMSDVDAATIYGARRQAHWILWSTIAFLSVALIWASRAQLDEVTVGQGQVIPSSRLQVVQNLEGGIVAGILVEPGQVVRKGQPLIRIDDTRFSSSYLESTAKDDALRARIARLEAEVALARFAPPADLQRKQPELIRHEQVAFDARRGDLQASLAVLQRQAEQREQELAEVRAHIAQLEVSFELAQQELAIARQAAQKDVFPKVELLRRERQANDLHGELETARLSMPRLQAAQGEVRQKSEQVRAQFRATASSELSEARAEQAIVSAGKVAVEDRLARTTVRAPVTGTVKQVKVNTIGGVVQPGMDLVEIVPLEDSLLIEARVRPADIAFLRPGLDAMVKLSAYDFSIYGGLEGRVEHISADAIVDERSGARSESYYLVRIRTSRGGRGAGEHRLRIIPGMQATVDIRTGRKTVLQYLLKPVLRAKNTALRER